MPLGAALGIDAGIAYGMVVLAALLLPETSRQRATGRASVVVSETPAPSLK